MDDTIEGLNKSEYPIIVDFLRRLGSALEERNLPAKARSMRHVLHLCLADAELGGLGLTANTSWNTLDSNTRRTLDHLICAWLAAAEMEGHARRLPEPLRDAPVDRLPMTLCEKILCHHAFSVPRRGVAAGDVIRVSLDWVIASELSWGGMKNSLAGTGIQPHAWRNNRFWLAGDHTVDPRINHLDKVQRLLQGMNAAKFELNMTENQGANFTILHTEFVRERAEPGMLVIGSDSHTCSAGAVSALAIGLGAADTMAGLVTGETWLRVPETIRINFTGKMPWYLKGKDVILSILRQLKRNTYAAERVVEFGGPSAALLSCDSRFAICNMCAELGAVTGLFAPDANTADFVKSRKAAMYKSSSLYFAPDEGARYAQTFEVDLGEVESFIALHPSPDLVMPVTDRLGERFDGCFIGACTTTEEELVLAALVLEAGLKRGYQVVEGQRMVVPGSMPIVRALRESGLLQIYQKCGFQQPAPGCSMCLGIGADVAAPGSRWLSSQNRNFKNRMGAGAVNHICSAATVAASSFSLTLTDPRNLLEDIPEATYERYLALCKRQRRDPDVRTPTSYRLDYVEPGPLAADPRPHTSASKSTTERKVTLDIIRSHAYRLGDYVDTDAIIPATACVKCTTNEQLGQHCLELCAPSFRNDVKTHKIIVGGKAFGCGSSREEAARALKGAGVACVIARSFSFIFGRNAPSVGLLAIALDDDEFHGLAEHGEEITIDPMARTVCVRSREFRFELGNIELDLIVHGGLADAMRMHGDTVFAYLSSDNAPPPTGGTAAVPELRGAKMSLEW
ncbi:hypothetical protein BST61_g4389 [Cercospora zeina]